MREFVGKFEKVSKEQYIKDYIKIFQLNETDEVIKLIEEIYNEIKLPVRGTDGSAGYDFHIPFGITLSPHECILIPTGIRCRIDDGWFLGVFPRSGLGVKYRTSLVNTIPVIDSDYYNAKNEGHILIKLSYDTIPNPNIMINKSDISDSFERINNKISIKTFTPQQILSYDDLVLEQNDRFVQGIFVKHGYDESEKDKVINTERTDGFGSTGLQ